MGHSVVLFSVVQKKTFWKVHNTEEYFLDGARACDGLDDIVACLEWSSVLIASESTSCRFKFKFAEKNV